MRHVAFLIRAGIVILVVAIVFRFYGFHNANPIPFISTTPGGLHRLVDSLFLLAIALALVEIHFVLQRGGSALTAASDKAKSTESGQDSEKGS